MRVVIYVFICLLLVLVGSMSRAAEPVLLGKELAETVGLPPQLPQDGVSDFLLELREERPGSSVILLTHFPQGLGENLDKAIASMAAALHTEAYSEVRERSGYVFEQSMKVISSSLVSGRQPLDVSERTWGNTFASTGTYVVSRPSEDYVSVLFRTDMSGGGAHANWVYRAASFHRAEGKELSLEDLFPGKKNVREALASYILKALGGRQSDLTVEDLDIGIQRFVLSPEGARVVYAPYEIGAYSEGEFMIDISMKELLDLGAAPAIWGRQVGM